MQKPNEQEDFFPPHSPSRFNFEKSLETVIKNSFLIFQGNSRLNEDYRVIVVKKKCAFDPALIALFEKIGVKTCEHNAGDGSNIIEE